MIMVSVNVGKDQDPVVGLLLDTHLMSMQGAPNVTMGSDKKLIQTPGQTGLQAYGVVATDKGFIVGPLASMTPIMNPDGTSSEEGEDDSGGRMSIGKEGTDDVSTELRPGEGRTEEGE